MINYKFILISICCIVVGGYLMFRNKFYKRKEHDMLWATGSNSFGSSIVLVLFGLLILFYELKKLF